jgi:hypothetical protein
MNEKSRQSGWSNGSISGAIGIRNALTGFDLQAADLEGFENR